MENQQNHETQTIPIKQIRLRVEYQHRDNTSGRNVGSLKTAYLNEERVPPLTVMRLDGELFLIQGWHRLEALTQLRRTVAKVIIIEGRPGITPEEVRVMAGLGNSTHGEPLKRQEKQRIFFDYMTAGMNKKGVVGLKSYTEIVKDLPCFKRTTIHGWMKRHYRDVAEEMSKRNAEDNLDGGGYQRDVSRHAPQPVVVRQIEETLLTVYAQYRKMTSEYVRGDALESVEETLRKMRKLKHKHRMNGVLSEEWGN